jgi:hypothetical protein
MKNLSTLILFASAYLNLNAAVLTVSNTPTTVAQYSTIAAAMTAANPGDTIYVNPSGVSYGVVTITKSLVFIGSGAWPEGQAGARSTVNYFVLNNGTAALPNTLDGTVIKGFSIIGSGGFQIWAQGSASTLNNIIIEFNYFGTSGSYGIRLDYGHWTNVHSASNWIIRNNIGNVNVYDGQNNQVAMNNWLISNNVTRSGSMMGRHAASSGNLFANNIIYQQSSNDNPLRLIERFTLNNNIIYGGQNFGTGDIKNCVVSHNLFYGNYTQAGVIASSSSGTNNLYGTTNDPMFVQVGQIANLWNYNPTAPFTDFNLQTGSPAIGSGTNNSNMGIYSGSFPWMDNPAGQPRTYYPGARIPEIYEFTIPGVSIPNSTMQIQIKARNAN